ncbi:septation ring formation regulator EzrA [Secundilactobacillus similis]|uniref:septation ring formation regulator EzrA n=1 Tax=Secundilactobacillus similis TaxID=414682 RepID=UPI0006D080E1|nr:septation ring formation regulator EzrA [Secundilactobacillus similis]
MFRVLIGIIILAIVIYAGVLIYQQVLIRKLKAVDQKRQALDIDQLVQAVDQVKRMSLTGKTLEQVKALVTDFQELTDNRLPRLAKQTSQAITAAKQYHVFAAQQAVGKANESLKVAQQAIDELQAQVKSLKDLDTQHKEAVKSLEGKYQSLRKTLLAKNFMYGPAIDGLEGQLAQLEDDNDHFRELTSQGDHEKAAELLAQLQRDTDRLEEMIQQIPPLFKNIETQFPDQIRELQQGEQTLTAEGYKYPEADLSEQINALTDQVAASKTALGDLDLDTVSQNDTAIATKIDHFYDLMEQEMNAKPKAEANLDYLAKFIAHAKNQNSLLLRELERLNLNYTLDHQELETARGFREQLRTIEGDYQSDVERMHDQTAVMTQVVSRQEKQKQEMTQIEQQQQEINDSVAGLAKEEQQARETLQQFEFEMHSIKRQVENLNLPGASKAYQDYYMVVSDEIKKLNENINQVQINMEDITKQLIMIQSDLDILTEKTDDLVDSALLAEQLIQYANRYRLTHAEVAEASQKAQQLFDNDFDYAKSLETIATVLDQVEPGSYKRLEDQYYQNKQTTTPANEEA